MKHWMFLVLVPFLLHAQEFEFRQEYDTIPVEIDGWRPFAPWMGGYSESHPDFCDIDSDGDLDLLIGHYFGYVDRYQNDGTAFFPYFTLFAQNWDSVSCFPNNSRSNPDLWDLDGDLDKDLLIGAGYVRYYRNEGSPTFPNFTGYEDTLFDISGNWVFGTHVALLDIDLDGDGDLVCGEYQGHLQFYRNIGTPDSFAFYLEDDNWLGISVGNGDDADPVFCDIDNDDDLDLFIGEENGQIWYYRNDGDSVNYDFTYVTDYYNNIDVGEKASPEFADIDGDGDYDLFVGRDDIDDAIYSPGDVYFYENIGTPDSAVWRFITKNYLSLDEGERALNHSTDINADTDNDLFLGNYGNSISYFVNIGTTINPSFMWITGEYQGITINGCIPFFCDIDSDQDPDLFVGEGIIPNPPYPGLYFFQNIGTPQNALFYLESDNLVPGSYYAAIFPSLADIDADGDNDIFLCDNGGTFYYSENVGTPLLPSFAAPIASWQGISVLGGRIFRFYDLDEDQDLDLFFSEGYYGDTFVTYYHNLGSPQSPLFSSVPDTILRTRTAGIFFRGLDIIDIDNDEDGDFFIGTQNNGGILFFRNVTGEPAVRPKVVSPYRGPVLTLGPNPANPVTWVTFSLPTPQKATLAVYNLLGRKVATLTQGLQPAGVNTYLWNASQFSSGVYVIKLETPKYTSSQRITIIK